MYVLHWMQWMREDYFYIEALMIAHAMVGNMSDCPDSERFVLLIRTVIAQRS